MKRQHELVEQVDELVRELESDVTKPLYLLDEDFNWKMRNQAYHFIMFDENAYISMRRRDLGSVISYSIANFSPADHFNLWDKQQKTLHLVSAIEVEDIRTSKSGKKKRVRVLSNIHYLSSITTSVDFARPPKIVPGHSYSQQFENVAELAEDYRWQYTEIYNYNETGLNQLPRIREIVQVAFFVVEKPVQKRILDFADLVIL